MAPKFDSPHGRCTDERTPSTPEAVTAALISAIVVSRHSDAIDLRILGARMKNGTARFLYLLMALLITLGSGGYSIATAQTPEASPAASPVAEEQLHGIQIENLDLTVDPGDDFYQFANGGWLDRTELPGSSPAYGVFDELNDKVTAELQEVVFSLEADPTTDIGKVKVVYDQFTNEEERNANGIEPIQSILDEIAEIDSVESGLLYQQTAVGAAEK